MPCTTLLVGKRASYNGSTLMARNEDSGGTSFDPKKFIVVKPEEQPKKYKSVISGVEIELPENPMRYTAMPNAIPDEGIWGEAGFNELNVAMSETETITSNARVLGADPLVKTGIGEEDMLTIVLPYIKSAREGVLRLGEIIEKYGTYEMNGIGFQDAEEIWWFESIGGHHFIAKRVPDDEYVVMPNQMGIDDFDMSDAFGEQRDHICSKDLAEFITENHLDLTEHDCDVRELMHFDTRAAFGSHEDSDHAYNTPRAWFMERYFNPNGYKWDGEDADYKPTSDFLPWSMSPERKITIEDVKYVLSGHFQGTPYDPYSKHADPLLKGMFRPIGVNRNNFLAITEIRPDVPKEIAAVEWISVGSNVFNASVPFYGNVNSTPEYLNNTDKKVTTENFYWTNRIVAALADAHFAKTAIWIERYQNHMAAKGHEFLKKYDRQYLEMLEKHKINSNEAPEYLEKCNLETAEYTKEQTYDLLDKVLYNSSLEMKNAYGRSDA